MFMEFECYSHEYSKFVDTLLSYLKLNDLYKKNLQATILNQTCFGPIKEVDHGACFDDFEVDYTECISMCGDTILSHNGIYTFHEERPDENHVIANRNLRADEFEECLQRSEGFFLAVLRYNHLTRADLYKMQASKEIIQASKEIIKCEEQIMQIREKIARLEQIKDSLTKQLTTLKQKQKTYNLGK